MLSLGAALLAPRLAVSQTPSRKYRLGVLVMDEAFDCWERQKNAQDNHLYFAEWWQRDIDAMVRRDRNHPSVIFWSIGNEIPERAETRGVEIAKQMVERIRSLDPSRPITAGINGGPRSEGLDPAFQHLDVAGYNYLWGNYEADHARLPNRVILGTESFPQHAFQNWQLVEKHPFVIGDFVWTGMDHLGESSIGNAQLASPGRGGGGPQAPAATSTPAIRNWVPAACVGHVSNVPGTLDTCPTTSPSTIRSLTIS